VIIVYLFYTTNSLDIGTSFASLENCTYQCMYVLYISIHVAVHVHTSTCMYNVYKYTCGCTYQYMYVLYISIHVAVHTCIYEYIMNDIGELNNLLTTKIITLLEFFNLLASFLVCSRSDKVTADAFGNLWGKCVPSLKKCIFISLEKCFCTFFCEFFEVIFDCTCALADQSLYAGILALLSLPRLALRAEMFQECSLCCLHDVP
jgi:hypothetical protein